MDIGIIGGGIAGLATALCIARLDPSSSSSSSSSPSQPKTNNIPNQKITIYESAPALSELGAGLQISANGTRIFHALGLGEAFKKVADEARVIQLRRYADDSVLGEIAQNPQSEWDYGFPHWQIYRPDFQRLLAEACKEETSKIRLLVGKKATSINHEIGNITFASGETVTHDVVVIADGINSRLRNSIPEISSSGISPRPFREFCLRAIIPKDRILSTNDPSLTTLIQPNHLNLAWCGPHMCMLGYPISSGDLYNLILIVPRPADETHIGKWHQPGDLSEGEKLLQNFSSTPQKLWKLVDSCHKWTLGDLPPLPTFVSSNGKIVVVGDAAHAILPYAGNGGGQALEDAASLAIFLNSIPHPNPEKENKQEEKEKEEKNLLPQAISAWNTLRLTRLSGVRNWTMGNQGFLTLPDGPLQEKRDEELAKMTAGWKQQLEELGGEEGWKKRVKPKAELKGEGDIRSPEMRMWLYGYDVIADARRVVREMGLLGEGSGE